MHLAAAHHTTRALARPPVSVLQLILSPGESRPGYSASAALSVTSMLSVVNENENRL